VYDLRLELVAVGDTRHFEELLLRASWAETLDQPEDPQWHAMTRREALTWSSPPLRHLSSLGRERASGSVSVPAVRLGGEDAQWNTTDGCAAPTTVFDDDVSMLAAFTVGATPGWPTLTTTGQRSLVTAAGAHGLSGAAVCAAHEGSLELAEAPLELARQHLRLQMGRCMALDATLSSAAEALTAADVEFRVLKGCAHANLMYADATLRPYFDVDLLVRSNDLVRSIDVLAELGARRRARSTGRRWEVRYAKGVTLWFDNGIEIDVHRTLARGPFGLTIEPDELFDRTESFDLGGRSFDALAPEERFLHSCLQVVTDDAPKVLTLCDVLAAGRSRTLDPGRVTALADRWHLRAAVADATRTAEAAFGVDGVSTRFSWLHGFEPSSQDRRVLRCYRAQRARWTREAVTAFPMIDGWSNRLSFARGVVFRR
jgi:hypothetical protein